MAPNPRMSGIECLKGPKVKWSTLAFIVTLHILGNAGKSSLESRFSLGMTVDSCTLTQESQVRLKANVVHIFIQVLLGR